MNRFFTLLLAAFCSTAVGQVPDYVPTDGLLGWWALDGNAACEVGGIDDGLVFGPTPTENRFGFEASAFRFDGNDRIEISDQTELRPESFTVSIWAWVDASNGQTQQFVAKNAGNGPYESVDVVRRNDNSVMCNIGGPDFWGTWLYDSSNEFPPSQWNHIVYCFDDSLNHQFLYQNGALIDSGSVSESIEYDSLPWTLGAERENEIFSWWLVGRLDDFGLWDRVLSSDEVSELFTWTPIVGCTDATACNFNADAMVDDGSCYSCDIPASHCGPGTIWDVALQQCVVAEPAYLNEPGEAAVLNPCYFDSDDDGLVNVSDLMNLLTVYNLACGDAPETTASWQCGDPLEYQGYDYATVQIGNQCWFAENLRAENYRNGESIPSSLSDGEWSSTSIGAVTVYGEGASNCIAFSPDGNACAEDWSLNEYGRLYNWFAVDDPRHLCPQGWHVPADEDWMTMEVSIGMSSVEVTGTGWRGTDEGIMLKNGYGWQGDANGTNSTGFSALPGGSRWYNDGRFHFAGFYGYWWTSTFDGQYPWDRFLDAEHNDVGRSQSNLNEGFFVRCMKDAD